MKHCLFSLCIFVHFWSCSSNTSSEPEIVTTQPEKKPVAVMAYTITNIFLHDTSLFTEGLFFRGNTLLESTGSPEELPATKSMAGISDLRTGKFEKKIEIDRNKFFGEGIAVLNKKLYQLTYLNQTGFIYDVNTYQKLGEFKFDSKEGWGLTMTVFI